MTYREVAREVLLYFDDRSPPWAMQMKRKLRMAVAVVAVSALCPSAVMADGIDVVAYFSRTPYGNLFFALPVVAVLMLVNYGLNFSCDWSASSAARFFARRADIAFTRVADSSGPDCRSDRGDFCRASDRYHPIPPSNPKGRRVGGAASDAKLRLLGDQCGDSRIRVYQTHVGTFVKTQCLDFNWCSNPHKSSMGNGPVASRVTADRKTDEHSAITSNRFDPGACQILGHPRPDGIRRPIGAPGRAGLPSRDRNHGAFWKHRKHKPFGGWPSRGASRIRN